MTMRRFHASTGAVSGLHVRLHHGKRASSPAEADRQRFFRVTQAQLHRFDVELTLEVRALDFGATIAATLGARGPPRQVR
jgi:hypothetical protein